MIRVKFIQATKEYGLGACVYMPDAEAQRIMKTGKAIRIEDTPVAGDVGKSVPMKRVVFNADVKTDDPQNPVYPCGARATVPAALADKYIASGKAEEFPVSGTEDTKEPVENKMMTSDRVRTKPLV